MPKTATSDITARGVAVEIRATRLEAGMTQAQLAKRLGVTKPYVTNLEAGRENLTLGQLANIANGLGAGLHVSFPRPCARPRVELPDRQPGAR